VGRDTVSEGLALNPQFFVFDTERRPNLWLGMWRLLENAEVAARKRPVIDSLERIENDRVVAQVDRENLFHVVPPYLMTPEFLTGLVDRLTADPTDWFTAAVEAGAKVRLLEA
jgi:2-C-methyl-D-erythritol 4-phosphate cytidylyltransferase